MLMGTGVSSSVPGTQVVQEVLTGSPTRAERPLLVPRVQSPHMVIQHLLTHLAGPEPSCLSHQLPYTGISP